VNFSSWALEAQDAALVKLLRAVDERDRGPSSGCVAAASSSNSVTAFMAVFAYPTDAVDGRARCTEGDRGAGRPTVYRPRMRIGMHTGRPAASWAADYLGVDVNIAARVPRRLGRRRSSVSETTFTQLDPEVYGAKRTLVLPVRKGAPRDLRVHSITAKG